MKSESLFSTHWHHVRDVRARLADDVKVTRHVYRNRVYWMLHRDATNATHRLDTQSFELIDQLNGTISVGEVWEHALEQRDHAAPTQDAWMHLLADLHAADLLIVDTRIHVESLFERRKQKRSRNQHQRYLNPLYLRFALCDPNAALERVKPLANIVFSRFSFMVWLCLIGLAVLVMFTHSERLMKDIANAGQLSPYIAALFMVLYPPLKLFHELGHALAVKRYGGSVREMGLALMVMFPLPYVDASASSTFKARRDRMLVSAAGIMVELGFAALGVLLWVSSDGVASDVGLVLMLIGALSTILINGNPLLKFDGYYVFSDWLEIPNLQGRARRCVAQFLRRLLSGKSDTNPQPEDNNELRWLLFYGISSGIYRTGLMLTIAWIISERWLVFGIALAVFAIFQAVILPLWRATKALFSDTQLKGMRAKGLALGIPAIIIAIVSLAPLPHASVTRGVVWLPEEAVIRAAGICEVNKVMIEPGSEVHAGDILFECTDSELQAQRQYLLARVAELEARVNDVALTDQVEYARRLPELQSVQTLLDDVLRRTDSELHRATVSGRFDVSGTAELLGRAFVRGDIAGYTIPPSGRTIRLAFPESQIADLDDHIQRIEVRVQGSGLRADVHATSLLNRSPGTSMEVPSAALSDVGGGPHRADQSGDGRQLLDAVVDIELGWPEAVAPVAIGQHVGVRFVHSPKPLAGRLINSVRRAFIDRLPV